MLIGLLRFGAILSVAAPLHAGAVLDGALELDEDVGAASIVDAGTVEGIVVDAATDRPLPGSLVTLVELGREELTHADGSFHFAEVPVGRHTLTVERIGYARETLQIDVSQNETTRVRVTMRVSALAVPGVIVTGTPGARLGDDAVRPTATMTGSELARKLDGTIGATLEREPGLASMSMGPATSRPVIRGLSGDRVLMLEDGARVGDMSSASTDHAVAVEPISARRIEVVRGPAALLYGSNALGGVVNVIREEIPTSPVDGVHGTLSIQGQSVHRGLAGEGSALGNLGPFTLRAEATARRQSDLRTPRGELENTWTDAINLAAGAGWITERGHVGASYRIYDTSYGIPPDPISGHEHGVRIEMRRHAVRGEALLHDVGGPFTDLRLSGGYTHYVHREFEDEGIFGGGFGLLTANAELQAQHGSWGPFAQGAVGARAEWRDFAAGGNLDTPPVDTYNAAAFFFEEFDLSPVRFHFGARLDGTRIVPRDTHTSFDIGTVRTRDFASLSGSIGVLYAFAPGWSAGVSLARAFRTPDANELFSQGPHLASYSYEVGNPDLEEEIGVGVDAFVRVATGRVQGEVAIFRNAIRNFIYPRRTGELTTTGLPVYQYSGENAVLTGFEGGLETTVGGGVVVDATVSYVRGTLTDTGEALPFIPPLRGQLEARIERPDFFLAAGVSAARAQRRVGEFETPTDGYAVFHAGGGYRWLAFGRVHSISVSIDNLTDTEYRQHLSRIKELMPEAGRNVRVLYRLVY